MIERQMEIIGYIEILEQYQEGWEARMILSNSSPGHFVILLNEFLTYTCDISLICKEIRSADCLKKDVFIKVEKHYVLTIGTLNKFSLFFREN